MISFIIYLIVYGRFIVFLNGKEDDVVKYVLCMGVGKGWKICY